MQGVQPPADVCVFFVLFIFTIVLYSLLFMFKYPAPNYIIYIVNVCHYYLMLCGTLWVLFYACAFAVLVFFIFQILFYGP